LCRWFPRPRNGIAERRDVWALPLVHSTAMPVTRHSCRRRGSLARAHSHVIERMLPAELAKQLEQVLLTSAGYELLECPGDGSSLGSFALSLRITSPARSDEELPTATATSGCKASNMLPDPKP
jgi:hypothetical protein